MDNFWIEFPGCECLKRVLINSGYDNLASLKCISFDLLSELEKDIQKNRHVLQTLNCGHKKAYLEQNTFEFLPGHRGQDFSSRSGFFK